MEARITVELDNAAFDPDAGNEFARILRQLADQLDGTTRRQFARRWAGGCVGLRDINGNSVGCFEVTE